MKDQGHWTGKWKKFLSQVEAIGGDLQPLIAKEQKRLKNVENAIEAADKKDEARELATTPARDMAEKTADSLRKNRVVISELRDFHPDLLTTHDTKGDTKPAERTCESGGNRPNGAHARGLVLSFRSARRFTSSTSQDWKVSELDGTRKPESEHRRKEFVDESTAQKSLLNAVKASSDIRTGHSGEARRVIRQSQLRRSRRVLRHDRDSETDEQNTLETMENHLGQSTALNRGATEESTVPVSEKRFLKISDDKDK